jgi:hypothetical protein
MDLFASEKVGMLVYKNSKPVASRIYHMLSLDLPPCIFNMINKLLRGFIGSAMTKAGKRLNMVVWDTVCTPKDLGDLGVEDPRFMNHALCMRLEMDTDLPKVFLQTWQGLVLTFQLSCQIMPPRSLFYRADHVYQFLVILITRLLFSV